MAARSTAASSHSGLSNVVGSISAMSVPDMLTVICTGAEAPSVTRTCQLCPSWSGAVTLPLNLAAMPHGALGSLSANSAHG
jgi:hypothetical protein